MILALAAHNPACADSTVDYSFGTGRSSNIFQDTNALAAKYSEGKLGLRGSLDLESSHLTYGLAASARRVEAYRFADQRTAGLELGYALDVSDAAKLTVKGGIEHRRSGDIFLALPGAVIGYSKADLTTAGSVGLAVSHHGGKSQMTAGLSSLRRGRSHFNLAGITPVRLDADEKLLDLTAGHIRPLMGGEIGATLQYRSTLVPEEDRYRYERFPAQSLRGSIAYGRRFDGDITVLAELGLVNVMSRYLGESVRSLRPFLRGEVVWQPGDWSITAKAGQDASLTDIDDPLGEYGRRFGVSVERKLAERLKIGLGYEQIRSDWLYYDYATRTDSLTASMTVGINARHAFQVEYSHLTRREQDSGFDYKVNTVAARVTGAF